jgi:hypothetical protein
MTPSLVRTDKKGHTYVPIFNCLSTTQTLKKNEVVGHFEKEDQRPQLGSFVVTAPISHPLGQKAAKEKEDSAKGAPSSWIDEFRIDKMGLSGVQGQRVVDVLFKNWNAISENKADLGLCNIAECLIPTWAQSNCAGKGSPLWS